MKMKKFTLTTAAVLGMFVTPSFADDPSCHGDLISFCESRVLIQQFFCCYTDGTGCCQYVCQKIDCDGTVKVDEVYTGSYSSSSCQSNGQCSH